MRATVAAFVIRLAATARLAWIEDWAAFWWFAAGTLLWGVNMIAEWIGTRK